MNDLGNVEILSEIEVNQRIPLVQRVMNDLRDSWVERRETKQRLRLFRRESTRNASLELVETIENLEERDRQLDREISDLEHEVHQLGGIVKDPGRGAVNFFSERNGALVFLSWMLGEGDVRYWHELDAGLAERQKLFP